MQDWHTFVVADETAAHDRLRPVPTATLGVSEQLAGRQDGHLARFAKHMREGLLAASDRGRLGHHGRADAGRGHRPRGPKGQARPGPDRQAPRQPGRQRHPRAPAGTGPPPQGPHGRRRRARADPGVV
jgi:hypothetical protein